MTNLATMQTVIETTVTTALADRVRHVQSVPTMQLNEKTLKTITVSAPVALINALGASEIEAKASGEIEAMMRFGIFAIVHKDRKDQRAATGGDLALLIAGAVIDQHFGPPASGLCRVVRAENLTENTLIDMGLTMWAVTIEVPVRSGPSYWTDEYDPDAPVLTDDFTLIIESGEDEAP